MRRDIRDMLLTLASALPYLVAECVLSYFVQRGDFVTEAMYFCVVLAFVFSMASLARTRGTEYNLVRLGLLITLLADYFLVVREPVKQLSGVITFCFVQMAYFAALILSDKSRTRRTVHIAVRAGLTVLVVPVAFAVLGESADALAIFSALYYVNLVCNTVFALMDFKKWWIFGVGLVAFCLCDASIGFTFLANEYLGAAEGSLIYKIAHSDLNLAWVFYVPSLTLIGLTPHIPLGERTERAE
ncbi:MAG: hypothetical protein IJF05_00995 [Clostridia bacterium]|nr:hypothetical protein [Clostridia bacterium]